MEKENQFILDLLRFSLNKKLKTKIKPSLKKQLDWNYILQTSRKHGISPILYKTLKSLNFKNKLMKEFEQDYYLTYFRNEEKYKELDKILKAFEKEDIDVIVLKGMYLAKHIYKDIGLRPMSDIDLLVKKQDLPKIDILLKKINYKGHLNSIDKTSKFLKISKLETNVHLCYLKKNICVEVHTRPTDIGLPHKRTDLLWNYYQNTKYRNNFDIVFLSTHLHQHSFSRIVWFYDLLFLLNSKRINWNFLYDITKQEGLKTSVYYALKFTEDLFKIFKINSKIKKIKPNLLRDKLFRNVWKVNYNFPFSSYISPKKNGVFYFNLLKMNEKKIDFSFKNILLNMLMMGRINDKIKYIIDYIYPPKNYIHMRYKIKNNFLIYLIYFYRPLGMIIDYFLSKRK